MVTRAYRRFLRVQEEPPIYRIPPSVAAELGYPNCAHCGNAIVKGGGVQRRGGLFHAACMATILRRAA